MTYRLHSLVDPVDHFPPARLFDCNGCLVDRLGQLFSVLVYLTRHHSRVLESLHATGPRIDYLAPIQLDISWLGRLERNI